jgi:transposase-like protein
MATEPLVTQDEPRRMNLRRARGVGFGSGAMQSSESLHSSADDNHEDLEQAPDVSAQVRESREMLAAPTPAVGVDGDDAANQRRLLEAAMAGDADYAREFRLDMIQKMLFRGISLATIARELGISFATVKRDKETLKERLRQRARTLDINELIGTQMAFYDEVSNTAMRVASASGVPTPMKLAGMRTALASNADRTRLLASAGVFDVISFRKAENGETLSDVQSLMAQTNNLLERLAAEEAEATSSVKEEPPAAPPAPRRRRVAGFLPMTFDDRDASGSTEEVVAL